MPIPKLPTPVTSDYLLPASQYGVFTFRQLRDVDAILEGFYDKDEVSLLRTPAASEAERGHQPEDVARARGGQVTLSGQINYLKPANLPTPTVADTFTDKLKSSQQKEGSMHSVNLGQAVHMEFGKFADAVARWEQVTGMAPPSPTKPDGKDGAPRLSS